VGRDPRRRIKAATIKSVLRKLEAIHQLAQGDVDANRQRIIVNTAESAYKELRESAPWMEIAATKRSEEIRSAARAIGLATEYKGRPLSDDVIRTRMESIAKARTEEDMNFHIPGYWFQ